MPLDLWIYGSGYGETIVMAWDDADSGGRRAAVVDNYGGTHPDHAPALRRWQELGRPPLGFVAATHPHFDHVRNLHQVLVEAGTDVERIFWWGGFSDVGALTYYRAVEERSPVRGRELVSAAAMAAEFLDVSRTLSGNDGSKLGKAKLIALMGNHPDRYDCGGVTVTPLSPWAEPQRAYTAAFRNQFRTVNKRLEVTPDRVQSNRTSLGLLVEYGQAQIVLGGDMEDENWSAWREANKDSATQLRPSVIKVSHHGSNTGVIPDMWDKRGFFGSHEGVNGAGDMPICVVTPWRRGGRGRQLPNQTVLDKIKAAGCQLVITGSPPGARGMELGNWYCDSFVHIEVQSNGKTQIIEHPLCEVHDPMSS